LSSTMRTSMVRCGDRGSRPAFGALPMVTVSRVRALPFRLGPRACNLCRGTRLRASFFAASCGRRVERSSHRSGVPRGFLRSRGGLPAQTASARRGGVQNPHLFSGVGNYFVGWVIVAWRCRFRGIQEWAYPVERSVVVRFNAFASIGWSSCM
jgi:hypothetical protein